MKKIFLIVLLSIVSSCTYLDSSKFEGTWICEQEAAGKIKIKKLNYNTFDVQFYEKGESPTGEQSKLNGEYKLSDDLNQIYKQTNDGVVFKILFTEDEKLYIGQYFFRKL